jgi:hypothetical protein
MIWFLSVFGDSLKRYIIIQLIYTTATPRWRGQALPSRESLIHEYNGGPDGAARARGPTPHGGRPPKDARHAASPRLWWPAWLRGLGGGLRWRSRAGGLCLPIAWGPHEAAAEEIEACPAKHLAFEHFEAIDMPLDRAGRLNGQLHPITRMGN